MAAQRVPVCLRPLYAPRFRALTVLRLAGERGKPAQLNAAQVDLVHMCLQMSPCMSVPPPVRMAMDICVCTLMSIRMCMHMRMHVRMHMSLHMYMRLSVHTSTHVYTHVYKLTCTHVCTHACTHFLHTSCRHSALEKASANVVHIDTRRYEYRSARVCRPGLNPHIPTEAKHLCVLRHCCMHRRVLVHVYTHLQEQDSVRAL